ncbi:hypothetical protein [Curtobacterium sp. UNCCL17]|uniref:hypothetical protein n=1 Tax=Curtobacterium sp. UNCCL17 TaxID=1449051 RepID=UPI000481FACE|nr:hypothetical protein [Curtobacterium sp. UNCCL17]
MDVEIVDLGWRCNVVVTADDRQVTVIGDLDTGRRLISSAAPELADLVDLASAALHCMRATRNKQSYANVPTNSLDEIATLVPGSQLLGTTD